MTKYLFVKLLYSLLLDVFILQALAGENMRQMA
jgi:hypothetical protein